MTQNHIMENIMKKLMILDALGTAALFTACGDDSSSSAASLGCQVTSTENSVKMVQTVPGYGESVTTWTIADGNLTTEYSDFPQQNTTVPAEGFDIASLKAAADKTCEEFNNAETVPAE